MTRLFLKEVLFDTADPLPVFLHFPSLDFISHAGVMRAFEISNPVDCSLIGDVDQVFSAGICARIVHGCAKTRGFIGHDRIWRQLNLLDHLQVGCYQIDDGYGKECRSSNRKRSFVAA